MVLAALAAPLYTFHRIVLSCRSFLFDFHFGRLAFWGSLRRRNTSIPRDPGTGARVGVHLAAPAGSGTLFAPAGTCAARRDHFTLPLQSERNGGGANETADRSGAARGSEANIYTIRNEVSSRSIDLPGARSGMWFKLWRMRADCRSAARCRACRPRLRATIMRPPTTDCVTPSSPIYLYNRQIRTPRIFSRRYPTGLALTKSEEAWSLPTTGR